jgi:hypothetical protein
VTTEMSKNCPVCQTVNNPQTTFCDSCGSPLEKDDTPSYSEEQRFSDITLGYASSLHNGVETKDSFLVLDATSLFGQENHRRIACVIVKGLAKFVDARKILNILSSDVIRQERITDHQSSLLEVKKFLDENSFLFSNDQEKTETGILVSLIDNKQFTSLCIDGPRILVGDKNCGIKVLKGTKKEPIVQINIMGVGDYVCLCNSDLFSIVGKQEIIDTISDSPNVQVAADSIVNKIKVKKPEISIALAIFRIIE